jgi:hypothetical protein
MRNTLSCQRLCRELIRIIREPSGSLAFKDPRDDQSSLFTIALATRADDMPDGCAILPVFP